MKSKLYQKNITQEIVKILRNNEEFCCKQADRVRQLRIDELFSAEERESLCRVSASVPKLRKRQDKVNSLNEILRQRATLECPTREFRGMISPRFWFAAQYTELDGYQRKTFLQIHLLSEMPSKSFFNSPRNLTSSSCELEIK